MKKLLSAALIILVSATACKKNDDESRNNTDKTYLVNNTTSAAEWKGSAPDHFHLGSFKVTGSLKTQGNGDIKEGQFVIPISSIENFDLPDAVKPELINHLKSADFFDIVLYANAEFKITKVESYTGPVEGVFPGTNKLVTGNFSMHGHTRSIAIPAKIETVGDSLKVEGTFKLDRSKWGMTKYTDAEAELYILPNADIHLKMQAAKQ